MSGTDQQRRRERRARKGLSPWSALAKLLKPEQTSPPNVAEHKRQLCRERTRRYREHLKLYGKPDVGLLRHASRHPK